MTFSIAFERDFFEQGGNRVNGEGQSKLLCSLCFLLFKLDNCIEELLSLFSRKCSPIQS